MPITNTASDTKSLVHAAIDVHEPGQTPGKVGALLTTIEFQLNPKEVTITKSAKWESKNQKKAASAPPATYQGPEPQKMSVEMYFDETRQRDGSVVKNVEALFDACTPTSASKDGDKPSAPWVKFKWGVLTGFVGYIKSVSAKYTLFSPDGKPLRAVCTVALEELAERAQEAEPHVGRPAAPSRAHPPRRRHARRHRLSRVRRPGSLAHARRGERHRRPDAPASRAHRAHSHARGALDAPTRARSPGGRSSVPASTETYTSLLLVSVGGSPLPPAVAGLLERGRITDAANLPDSFELEFVDSRRDRARPGRLRDRGVRHSRRLAERRRRTAEAARRRGHRPRPRRRRRRAAHPGARPRHVAPPLPRPPGRGVRRHVGRRHRAARSRSGPGSRSGRSSAPAAIIPHITQDNVSDWVFLKRLADASGCVFSVVDKQLQFGPPTSASTAGSGSANARDDPVVIEHGRNTTYLHATITSAEQVSEVEVRGLGCRGEGEGRLHARPRRRRRPSCRRSIR